jgi:hypothetical protein
MTRRTTRLATMVTAVALLMGGSAVAAAPASAGPVRSTPGIQTTCTNTAWQAWKFDATHIAAAMQVTCDAPVQFEPYLIVYVVYPNGSERSFIRQPFAATTGTDTDVLVATNRCVQGSRYWYLTHAYVKMDGWWELIDDAEWAQITC